MNDQYGQRTNHDQEDQGCSNAQGHDFEKLLWMHQKGEQQQNCVFSQGVKRQQNLLQRLVIDPGIAVMPVAHQKTADKHRHDPATAKDIAQPIGHKSNGYGQNQQLGMLTKQPINQQACPNAHQESCQDPTHEVLQHDQQLVNNSRAIDSMEIAIAAIGLILGKGRDQSKTKNGRQIGEGCFELQHVADIAG